MGKGKLWAALHKQEQQETRSSKEDLIEIEFGKCLATTDKSRLLTNLRGDKQEWLALSVTDGLQRVKKGDGPGVCQCQRWLANQIEWSDVDTAGDPYPAGAPKDA